MKNRPKIYVTKDGVPCKLVWSNRAIPRWKYQPRRRLLLLPCKEGERPAYFFNKTSISMRPDAGDRIKAHRCIKRTQEVQRRMAEHFDFAWTGEELARPGVFKVCTTT